MATAIFMPKAGMAMEEGTLIRWLKNVGDHVEMNEPVMEIETDKIAMEAEAPATGTLLATLAEPGAVVPVLQTIGWIGTPGEKLPESDSAVTFTASAADAPATNAPDAPAPAAVSGNGVAATPYARTLAKEKGVDIASIPPTGKRGEVVGADVENFAASAAVKATPLAAAIAKDQGIELSGLSGTGFAGKVTKADVLAAAAPAPVEAAETRAKLSGMRRVIAERMMKSYLEIPTATQSTDMDVTELMALREKINAKREKQDRITVNDFVLKAVALASMEFPAFRSYLGGDELVTVGAVHLGVAVSTDNGLLVPVIKNAQLLPLSALSAVAKDLAARARSNKLSPDECVGSTVTISNLGMFGVTNFTPIINQPNSAILGVCAIRDELALDDNGAVTVKKVMPLCVTLDHRIMDGALAAKFALRVKALLEQPLDMLI